MSATSGEKAGMLTAAVSAYASKTEAFAFAHTKRSQADLLVAD